MVHIKPELSVFIPVCNEEKSLEFNIKKIYEALKDTGKSFELIIVDDTSTDLTPAIAKKLAKNKDIRYIRCEGGPSRRENLAQEFKKAKAELIIYMDSDLAVDLKHLLELIYYSKKADIATGSRYMKESKIKRKFYRLIISKLYNAFLRILFNSKAQDHQCGFKAIKKKVALDLIKEMGYDKKLQRGWFWDAELLIRAQKRHYRIAEFPVTWAYGKKSSFSIMRELKMIPYVIKLRFRI